jgi:hypothetical protein
MKSFKRLELRIILFLLLCNWKTESLNIDFLFDYCEQNVSYTSPHLQVDI